VRRWEDERWAGEVLDFFEYNTVDNGCKRGYILGMAEIKDLIGKTVTRIGNSPEYVNFITEDGKTFSLCHEQECCENVTVEDICGELDDLVGSPIVSASEETSKDVDPEGVKAPEGYHESFTWTFYRLATNKGTVVIRWYGSSNGYYSESVSFIEVGE